MTEPTSDRPSSLGNALMEASGSCPCSVTPDARAADSETRVAALAFSVIIPTVGRATELCRTLATIRAATDGAYVSEIIVVHDGVAPIPDLHRIVAPIPLVSVGRRARCGPAACRNLGAGMAVSDYVVFLDDDVRVSEKWLRSVLEGIRLRRTCQTGPIRPDDDTLLSRARDARYRQRYEGISCNDPVTFLAGGNALLDRRWFLSMQGFPDHSVGSDSALIGRIRDSGHECVFCQAMEVGHRNDRGWALAITNAIRSGWLSRSTGAGFGRPRLSLRDPEDVIPGLVNLGLWMMRGVGRIAGGTQRMTTTVHTSQPVST